VFIAGFPAGAWGTNCYLVAPAAGEECVIVDPGHEATAGVEAAVREHGLKPVAVVLTHGHIDHVASVMPICGAPRHPAWIHPEDRYMLADPEKGPRRALGAQLMGELTVGEPTTSGCSPTAACWSWPGCGSPWTTPPAIPGGR